MAEEGTSSSNTFANDGSFLELFKKKMEQQKDIQKSYLLEKPVTESTRVIECVRTDIDSPLTDFCEATTTSELNKEPTPVHKPYQAIVGKRKAMMKSIELREKRKKRREELEEQQSAEDQDNKSSAWKSYMAEVKSYEAKNCSDTEGLKRPLVK